MTEHNFLTYSGKIIIQILGEILYFPFWWYSVGLVRLLVGLGKFLRSQNETLGFTIWVKNIFVPMYGQRDIAGRLISFVMRSVQIVIRGAALLFLLFVMLLILAFWLTFPIFLVYALISQLF